MVCSTEISKVECKTKNTYSKKEWFKLIKKLIRSAPNKETLRVLFSNIKEQEINLNNSEVVLLKKMIVNKVNQIEVRYETIRHKT